MNTQTQTTDGFDVTDVPNYDRLCARLRTNDKHTALRYAYEEGYDAYNYDLFQYLPSDEKMEIVEVWWLEGDEAAQEVVNEHIRETIDKTLDEHLPTALDDQFRMWAGYKLDKSGATIEEGNYGEWEDLRVAFEAGVQDRLRGREEGASLDALL